MKTFKVKFFGSKNKKEQITKQSDVLTVESESKIKDILTQKGWAVINGLKVREVL